MALTEYVTPQRLGKLLKLSTARLRTLADEGMPHRWKGKAREFPIDAATQWYVEYKATERERNEPEADFSKARARKTEAEASLAEMELKAARGLYITKAEYEKAFDEMCERMAGVIRAIPSKHLSAIDMARGSVEAQLVGETIRNDTFAALRGVADHDDEQEEAAA